jgi:hypothetical protein
VVFDGSEWLYKTSVQYLHQKSGLIIGWSLMGVSDFIRLIIRPDFWCIYLYTSLIKSLTPIKDHPIIRPDFWCIYLYTSLIGWSLMGVSDFIRLVYKYLHQKSGLIIGWSLMGVSDFIRLVYKYLHQKSGLIIGWSLMGVSDSYKVTDSHQRPPYYQTRFLMHILVH